MFHSSSIHNFDTMFVIFCVIAGATTHAISNSSKSTSIYKSNNRYKSSFIELLMEAANSQEHESPRHVSEESDDQPFWRHPYRAGVQELLRNRKESYAICAKLSNILNGNQIKFCREHHDILVTIMPRVMHLARRECIRITQDLRWNCAALDSFLDRSNSLAFTKEGALIRSLINASMMYLTVKTCEDNQFPSCGCNLEGESPTTNDLINSHRAKPLDQASNLQMDDVSLSDLDLRRLETGSALRLTRSMVQLQACTINIPFADAFTKVFMDAEDTRSLNKAYKILNEESAYEPTAHKITSERRLTDADYKDLSFIKWTKSAINLHNNHIGRQAIRDAITRVCRCHGVSGTCQYQTCWYKLNDIEVISSKLRNLYLTQFDLVKPVNMGTFSNPDLFLAKSRTKHSVHTGDVNPGQYSSVRIGSMDLAYLYQSPDFCDPHPDGWYPGIINRECSAMPAKKVSVQDSPFRNNYLRADRQATIYSRGLGDCQRLCCDRGFRSELILDLVDCNCRFRFCCRVECARCLRQQMRHFCL